LVLAPWLFHWDDPGLGFDVALHWGTLLAVCTYFFRDLMDLGGGFRRSLFRSTRDWYGDLHQRMAWLLVVATIPGALAGLLLESRVESDFRNPLLVAAALAVFGFVLLAADRFGAKRRELSGLGWRDAALIGLSQALAVVPGVSRSGSTMAAGLGLGLRRETAARFSFLMSIPIVLGAGLRTVGHFGVGVAPGALTAGFLAAAVFGFLSIRFLLRLLIGHGFGIFVWYRLGLAVLVAAVLLARG